MPWYFGDAALFGDTTPFGDAVAFGNPAFNKYAATISDTVALGDRW